MVRAISGKSNVTPWVAAQWSTKHGYTQAAAGRTKPAFFVDWPKTYKIKVTPIPGGSSAAADAAALAAVKHGNLVIAFMLHNRRAHYDLYIVWYDVAGSKALVRDPYSTSPHRTRGPITLLQQQAWNYYIVEVPDNKRLWS